MRRSLPGLLLAAILTILGGGCAAARNGDTMEPRGDRTMSGAGTLTQPPDLARRPDTGGVIVGAGGAHAGGGR